MMPPPLHVCTGSGLSSHVAMWQHWFDINSNFVGSFCPWYIFTQKLVSSSVGVAIHQISLKSVWYSCEVKNMSMLAWKRGTAGHTSGHSENIMPSTARRLHMHKTWNHPLFLKLWNSRKHLTYADFCLINYRQSIMTETGAMRMERGSSHKALTAVRLFISRVQLIFTRKISKYFGKKETNSIIVVFAVPRWNAALRHSAQDNTQVDDDEQTELAQDATRHQGLV